LLSLTLKFLPCQRNNRDDNKAWTLLGSAAQRLFLVISSSYFALTYSWGGWCPCQATHTPGRLTSVRMSIFRSPFVSQAKHTPWRLLSVRTSIFSLTHGRLMPVPSNQ
jgi:hypothetical protein